MAVSAYSSEGLLKKNPLLGTSLASDTKRKTEKEKFGSIFERAKGFINDRAGFQATIQAEQAAENAPELAALAAAEGSLGTSVKSLADLQTRQAELQGTLSSAANTAETIAGGNWKNMKAFEEANPEIAAAAQANWDALGKKGEKEIYYKGKRSGNVHEEYRDLRTQLESALADSGIEETGAVINSLGLQARSGGKKNIGGVPSESSVIGGNVADSLKQAATSFLSGSLGPGNPFSYGQNPLDMFTSGKGAKKAFENITDPGKLGFNPLLGDFKPEFDFAGGMKNIAKSIYDPGQMGKMFKSVLGIGDKSAIKKANRKMRAGGRELAYLDQLGLTRGKATLEGLTTTKSIDETKSRISDLQSTITSTKGSLADRANLYGGFFS